jgi:hypothetical protein
LFEDTPIARTLLHTRRRRRLRSWQRRAQTRSTHRRGVVTQSARQGEPGGHDGESGIQHVSRARIQAALAFLTQHAADAELTIVAASRAPPTNWRALRGGARGATFGVSRYGFNELLARLASPVLARARVAPASPLSLEAVAARASFEQADDLRYFEPVARMPGFPRSVARTLGELALAGVETGRLAALGDSGADLADLERGLRAETNGRAGGSRRRSVRRPPLSRPAASLRQAGPSFCSMSDRRATGNGAHRRAARARGQRCSPSRQTIARRWMR